MRLSTLNVDHPVYESQRSEKKIEKQVNCTFYLLNQFNNILIKIS